MKPRSLLTSHRQNTATQSAHQPALTTYAAPVVMVVKPKAPTHTASRLTAVTPAALNGASFAMSLQQA